MNPPKQAAIAVQGVTKHYGDVVALEGVDIAVERGEVVAILGPSGCGKSTLLKIVAGLYPATSGRIDILGRPVDGPSPSTGLMFQAPVLFPWLTVIDNVLLPIRVRRGAVQAARQRALDLLEFVGLTEFATSYPWQLSGGMQQRTAMCRMLIGEPSVLLLDEPFGAIDAMNREYLDVEVRSIINRTESTAVFVTHSVSEAILVSDRVVVLSPRPGRVDGEVPVRLGSARSKEMLASPDLLDHVRTVRQLLDRQDVTIQ